MLFGLTNIPSTFQVMMNQLSHELLRKYVILFFDDILIYSGLPKEHLQHLTMVFILLEQHSFFVKASECSFGLTELNYLGHIITPHGLRPDSKKINVVKSWLELRIVQQVRSFLGLTVYYQCFIEQYAHLTTPLTNLLKKDNFRWDEKQKIAFEGLTEKLITTPVLAYPNFLIPFAIDMDACDVRVGVVLLQNEHPISCFSKKLFALCQRASTYAKELWTNTNVI